ncbi:MAG: hypothetical protein QXZ44_04745 [Ferroplasma sp.]
MVFKSLLAIEKQARHGYVSESFLNDTGIDRIIKGIVGNNDRYDIAKILKNPLSAKSDIRYRQGIFSDLSDVLLFDEILEFAQKMDTVKSMLSNDNDSSEAYRHERSILDASYIYIDSIHAILEKIKTLHLNSAGLINFFNFLREYSVSPEFASLLADTKNTGGMLSEVRYSLLIKNDRVTVGRYIDGNDYSEAVIDAFKEISEAGKGQDAGQKHGNSINNIDYMILEKIAMLEPEPFQELHKFYSKHRGFYNKNIEIFAVEIKYYIECIKFINSISNKGLKFTLPEITDSKDCISCQNVFNIALALPPGDRDLATVANNFYFNDKNCIVITGRNNGGKTTFAGAIAQVFYLGSLGMPVPASHAIITAIAKYFSHYEARENTAELKSALENDILRIRDIISIADSSSLVIINEMFSSVTLDDARKLGNIVINRLSDAGVLSVYVTFVRELAYNDNAISMACRIDKYRPEIPTYRIEPAEPDNFSYAMLLEKKYGLDEKSVYSRVAR